MTELCYNSLIVLGNSKLRQAQLLIYAAAGLICLSSSSLAQGQEVEALGEKSSFLLRPETTFQHYCAPCHGETAQGDGRYFGFDLQPRPRDLTDAGYMNTRTDEDLVASIGGGTASIGKSNLCPPWGKTLGRERIEGIIRYLRSLSRALAVQDTVETTTSATAIDLVESGSPFQLASLITISLVLIGTAWLQWRRLPTEPKN